MIKHLFVLASLLVFIGTTYAEEQTLSPHVPGDFVSDDSGYISGRYENEDRLIEFKTEDVYAEVSDLGKSSFSFTVFKDQFEYKDGTGVFDRTYRDSADAETALILQLSNDKYLVHGVMDLGWQFNLSFGYNRGTAVFQNDQSIVSETKFTLWTVPVDLGVLAETSVGRLLKIGVAGGPSFMGLFQTRSDRLTGEGGKRRRQFSPGYYAALKGKLSLSTLFEKTGHDMYRQYKVSNMFLTLEARLHEYNQFQDEISVSGSSIGVGFSFEYI